MRPSNISAAELWREKMAEAIASGKSRAQAASYCAKHYNQLREEMIREENQR